MHSAAASFREAMKQMETITDNFVNDKCSNCGGCCSRLLPMTKSEVKTIKRFIKGKSLKIMPERQKSCFGTQINFWCPFLDLSAEHKCQIYPVRPAICKLYSCRDHVQGNFKPAAKLNNREVVDLYKALALPKRGGETEKD